MIRDLLILSTLTGFPSMVTDFIGWLRKRQEGGGDG